MALFSEMWFSTSDFDNYAGLANFVFSIPKMGFFDPKTTFRRWKVKKSIPNPFALVWAHADIILDEIRRYWGIFFLFCFQMNNKQIH